jgi:hypothetical protein
MWFIIFTKEGYNNEVLRIIKEGELRSFFLSGSIRKTLTPKLIEKIWNGSLCSEYVRLSEPPMNLMRIAKGAGLLVRWYEI